MKSKRSLTTVELILAFSVIFILFGVFAIYANINLRKSREVALRNELNNIRMSVGLYKMINSGAPEDLVKLINQDFTVNSPNGIILQKEFLKPFRLDKEGYLLDPFLNRYHYDNKSGKVRSATKQYEDW